MAMVVYIAEHFENLQDPRICTMNRRHLFLDIIVIAILAVLCGCEGWADIFAWAEEHQSWLSTFLLLPNGLPSRDCIRRVVSRLDPHQFQRCFAAWTAALCEATHGEIVAIDGKTLRRSFDRRSGTKALHLVSAWAVKNHVLLGQEAVEKKSNEITAIPRLLELLDITGAVVTIDAMGCQKEIARQIRAGHADYLLALKGNQEQMYEAVQDCFIEHHEDEFARVVCRRYTTTEHSHGRDEERHYYQMKAPADLPGREEWLDLRTIGMVINETQCNGKTSDEVRFYLSSLPLGVKRFAEAVRGHWQVENSLHWTLDVTFDEDHSRASKDHGAQNLGLLRRIALSLLKRYRGDNRSVRQRRLRAAWNPDYLLRILEENGAS
jgi:predicted transposase YbfD/YdcC